MPITSIDVRDGDPTVQASGQHRGTVAATFDDGRLTEKNIRASDIDDWNDKVAAASGEMQAQMESSDAHAAVDPDSDVTANKEASQAQTCVAYIRDAWNMESANDGWMLYSRINNYVTGHSNWITAKPHLIAEGLTDEEYEQAATAYAYLSGAGRPATMADAQTIQDAWTGQH
jgi:hypothetical protein